MVTWAFDARDAFFILTECEEEMHASLDRIVDLADRRGCLMLLFSKMKYLGRATA